jgi:hypothetical protein
MTRIKKLDQEIIQRKIDGVLSPEEEHKFKALMDSSPAALESYRKISLVHHTLKFNTSHIPEVNFADAIMEKIEADKSALKLAAGKFRFFTFGDSRQIMAYAAVLLAGLILGSIFTYYGTTHSGMTEAQQVTGTVARHKGNDLSFSNSGTDINIRKIESGRFLAMIIEVSTLDTIYCSLRSESQTNSLPEEIQTLYSEGQSIVTKQGRGYLCQGKNIFLVNNAERLMPGSITFSRNGKTIYEYKIMQD